ncbi:hypothetical protein J3Q64DRAFT_1778422 [Phycomyces blakesleeanus]|uniref:SIS domain-containing protein n=2 Tax=Phycomyces blakesleeanus TaxID=4837 RepID=A0A167M411_PHYB8|nr:hypothetical protein PHYBLDRAFT_182105 [Phycomyces blakesleeanus NRRL 1555(-)]OAD71727.1 hypothetical protein PHYBLDRAFT_182105 [Phycomyces blakesleeanus NRRL 1555(-)]|eukprot:XP_018289767.1 hypothetical protein PHYBLDRAFT_182105 [Phycomyces blakesleeanus NRRL 1555(-)]
MILSTIVDSAAKVLLEEAQALMAAAARLQSNTTTRDGYEQAIIHLFRAIDRGGKVVVTGVGKSGKIGEKMVATMLSTGTPAAFLHPVEALHGDLGVVHPNDCVLALSYSGNTEELLMLVPSLKRRQVPVVGLGGNPKSKLAKECVAWIDGHVTHEAGGDDLPAPTTSTTLALALGDAVALSLAGLRSFGTDAFALNHPGGSLGRRLLLKVEDAMHVADKVACVSVDAPLDIVIMQMTRHPKGCGVIVLENDIKNSCLSNNKPIGPSVDNADVLDSLLPSPPSSSVASSVASSVTEDEAVCEVPPARVNVLGVITHDDIHRILRARVGIFDIKAVDIMTRSPVVCGADTLASEAMRVMVEHPDYELPLLPVVDREHGFRGVVTLKDLQELF